MEKLLNTFYRIVMRKQAEGSIDMTFDRRWAFYLVVLLVAVAGIIYGAVRIHSLLVWGLVIVLGVFGFVAVGRAKMREEENEEN